MVIRTVMIRTTGFNSTDYVNTIDPDDSDVTLI